MDGRLLAAMLDGPSAYLTMLAQVGIIFLFSEELPLTCSPMVYGDEENGLITESYPETKNPYRIIPLITESYPYTKIWGMIR